MREIVTLPDICRDGTEVTRVVAERDAWLPDGIAVADHAAPDIVAQHVHGRLDFQAAVVGLLQFVRLGRADGERERGRSKKSG